MEKLSNKKIVILLGPPGSGKGVEGTLLSERFNLYHFETSKILEREFNNSDDQGFLEVEGEKYYYSDEKNNWKNGKLVSPPVVVELISKEIKRLHEREEGIIFSGSPRTIYEGERVIPLLVDLYGKDNIDIIIFGVKPETTIWRNSHRRICELMRHPILFNEETENLTKCPLDGSKLLKREGLDDVETIKVRLKEYQERTKPLIEYIKKQGLRFNEIDAEGSVEAVYREILKKIE